MPAAPRRPRWPSTVCAQVQGTSAGYGRRRIHLAASNGFSGGYARTDRALSLAAISGTGAKMERDYNGESRIFQADLPSPEEIGRIAGERAAARAGRQPAAHRRLPGAVRRTGRRPRSSATC